VNRLLAGALAALFSFAPALAAPAQCGIASWYGRESGSRTANGEPFPTAEPTAAHRTLPFGTRVRVIDQLTGRSVVVRINDRGPAGWTGRIIDLSPSAAKALNATARGVERVCLQPGAPDHLRRSVTIGRLAQRQQ